MTTEYQIKLRRPHKRQREIIESPAKRKVIRAGRRGGKTVVASIIAVRRFLAGGRVLYAAPTENQVEKFWFEIKRILEAPLDAKVFTRNETRHSIELSGTEQRIRAKTAWNADSLRGDYADLLILDEYQLMEEEAWTEVGAPMLLDNDGDAIFIYTTRRGEKGDHARRAFARAEADMTGRWAAFKFSSLENPYLSRSALDDITQDMTHLSYRAEIMAEEVIDDPGALWTRATLDDNRVTEHPPLSRIVVGVDPPGTAGGAECGIVAGGVATIGGLLHGYILDDHSRRGTPGEWGSEVVAAYNRSQADRVIGEVNNGGDMVEHTIRTAPGGTAVAYKSVRATRGKALRAEPVAALYERGRVHHVGTFSELEDQLCSWVPGDTSPDRLDALVWALTELMLGGGATWQDVAGLGKVDDYKSPWR